MKVLISGKGGTGKTTIAALLSLELSRLGYEVLALDTDSVPNLAQSLGIPLSKAYSIVPLARNEELAEERTGARPGEGWGVLFSLTPKVDDLVDKYGIKVRDRLSLVVVGSIDSGKEGCLCPAIALTRAFLNHVLLRKNEVVIVDSEAGAEVFGRGLAEKFDINLCITEPTLKSLIIAKKLIKLANDLGVKRNLIVINKVVDDIVASQLYLKVFSDEGPPHHIIHYDEELIKAEVSGKGLDKVPECSIARHDIRSLAEKVIKYVRI